jgi:hypothetical protein
LQVLPAKAAFTPSGAPVVGFTVQNQDAPQNAAGFGGSLSSSGTIPLLPGANQLLAVGAAGARALLMEGLATAGQRCCGAVRLVPVSPSGKLGAPRTLIGTLAEPSTGMLVPTSDGGALGLVATATGIWATRAAGSAAFGPIARLTPASATPAAVAAAALPKGAIAIGWTTGPQAAVPGAVGSIEIEQGGAGKLPSAAASHYLSAVPGDSIDSFALGAGAHGPTAVWAQSYTDTLGAFHSVIEEADAGALTSATRLSDTSGVASAASVGSDLAGHEVAVWKQCDATGSICAAWMSTRRGAGRFSPAVRLGAIDPASSPSVAVGANGAAVAGWVDGGVVMLSVRPPATGAFGTPARLGADASELSLSAGPGGRAIAVWCEGIALQRVYASVYG